MLLQIRLFLLSVMHDLFTVLLLYKERTNEEEIMLKYTRV